jgi:DNA polymerase
MAEIVLDFETASMADLGNVGSNIYAKHITTEILSLTYTIGDSDPWLWVPGMGADTTWLRQYAANPHHMWICHNAGFEKDIWREIMVPLYGFPDIPNERWHDILASCALRCWPLALDNALHTAGLPGKDMAASKMTRSLSKSDKKTGMLDRRPETMAKVYAYNKDDVVKERGLHKLIGYLPPAERKIWLLDQEINERGVKFDIPMIRGALKIYEAAKQPLLDEFRELTGTNPTQVAKFKDWLAFNGVELDNMRKETVNALLGDDDEHDTSVVRDGWIQSDALPDIARRALTIRTLVGSSSVRKFARMEQCADPTDGRIRRLLQYHGAGTGRWAGRLFNAHNMPRGLARVEKAGDSQGPSKAVPPNPELLAKAITSGSVEEVDALGCFIEYGDNRVTANPIQVLASALRSTIVADEGKYLLIGDWSAIEARLILAIAGQHDKTTLMASGTDVYLDMAEQIFNEKGLTKADVEKRQTGKNTLLGCGFQMGAEKFHERYCPKQPMEFAERAIKVYRKEWAPEVPKVWKALQEAALATVQTGCSVDTGYGIIYRIKGDWLV